MIISERQVIKLMLGVLEYKKLLKNLVEKKMTDRNALTLIKLLEDLVNEIIENNSEISMDDLSNQLMEIK